LETEPRAALSGRKAIVCVGAGGVGKTSVAAAIAVSAARRGRRVAALTVDPAARLADSLGVDPTRGEWQTIDAPRARALGIVGTGSLRVSVLDAERTLFELVERLLPDEQARNTLTGHPLFAPLGKYLAGAGEYMAMEKLLEALNSPEHDLVVLDTPPSRHALDLFEAPERFRRAVSNPVLATLLRGMPSKSQRGLDWVGRGIRMATAGIGRMTGEGTLQQITSLLAALPQVLSGFGERARAVDDALLRPDFAYVLVTRPNPVALELAREFSHSLEKRGLGTDLLVLNRTTRVAPEAELQQGLALLEQRLSSPAFLAARGAVEQRLARKRREQAQIAGLLREPQLKACPRLELPALQVGVSELTELASLADAFGPCW
jgi:anion-transporting  ArsA/GET3 family ATPase